MILPLIARLPQSAPQAGVHHIGTLEVGFAEVERSELQSAQVQTGQSWPLSGLDRREHQLLSGNLCHSIPCPGRSGRDK